MPIEYEPKNHIQHLAIALRTENFLDQREITIQSYQTNVPFDYEILNQGIESAWLTPQIRFGVFARTPLSGSDAVHVVLGLQDELAVRAYDYDARRPLWFTWQNIVVETISIHYFQDESGLLRFKATGGRRRITEDRLHDFNSAFLQIPKEAVKKRDFDLSKLRKLCFERFVDHLYMLRFADPSGEEYRSIDHALFQSRQYIDPQAERLHEIQSDPKARIESFDSDIEIHTQELHTSIRVRFFIRGLSGALRLRFPRISYKSEPKTMDEQARVFYHIVDITENSILDADYYTHLPRSLDELDVEWGLFSDSVDLAPFSEILLNAPTREQFFQELDLGAPWNKWQPHLRTLDELLSTLNIADHVTTLIADMISRDPLLAGRLLAQCQQDAKIHRIGDRVAHLLAGQLQSLPAEYRPQLEEILLSWAIDRECDSWDVNPDTGEMTALGLRWQMVDLSLEILPAVLWKLVGVLHARLSSTSDNTGSLLARFNWCMDIVKGLPLNPSKLPPALRLVNHHQVPLSLSDAAKVLRNRIMDQQSLDTAMLDQFGLPLWPYLLASYEKGKIRLQNIGIGSALSLHVAPHGTLFGESDIDDECDLHPNESTLVIVSGKPAKLDVRFSKFGKDYRLELPISYATKLPTTPVKKQIKKRTLRDATIGALKRELHDRILGFKNAIRSADDTEAIYDLPRITQKELAATIQASESSVSRAIAESRDLELQILLQTIENPDLIRKYSR